MLDLALVLHSFCLDRPTDVLRHSTQYEKPVDDRCLHGTRLQCSDELSDVSVLCHAN